MDEIVTIEKEDEETCWCGERPETFYEDEKDEVVVRKGAAEAILTPSTEEDFTYINGHLRFMDRFEQDHFRITCGVGETDKLSLMEQSWTLHLGGEIVGYVALQLPQMASPLSKARFIPMLSTTNVEHHRLDFARLTRPVFAYVMSQAPAWVTDFFSLPLAKYEATIRWHEKAMGWHRVAEYDIAGEKAILFHVERKEIEL